MRCAGAEPLLGSRPGELDPAEEALLQAHLASCAPCRARQADVEAVAALVEGALLRAAAHRDLSTLADGVVARIPELARRERPGPLARLRALLRRHRAMTVASAAVPALAAVALALYISRGGGARPVELSVQVTSEDLAAVVLDTSDGPVILVGEGPEGT